MNRFVLKNTFIKIYIYHFSINIFIEIRSQSYALETVSLSKMTSFTNLEGVFVIYCLRECWFFLSVGAKISLIAIFKCLFLGTPPFSIKELQCIKQFWLEYSLTLRIGLKKSCVLFYLISSSSSIGFGT
jgi:hypothetical protein